MKDIVKQMNDLLVNSIGVSSATADTLDAVIAAIIVISIGIGINMSCQALFRWVSTHNRRIRNSKWHSLIARHSLGHHIIMMIPGLVVYWLLPIAFREADNILPAMQKITFIYMAVVVIMVANAALLSFQDFYAATGKNRNRPLKGLIQAAQVTLLFIGAIVVISIVIGKSPAVLLTGLGASAAVLMLVFKDSILGLVAGVQLTQNNMVRIGDWIEMPDGSTNGIVEEITLNTVKVRNWDNTMSMIPPYTLTSTTFKNWRGMLESGGRRTDKRIFIDINSLEMCSEEMTASIVRTFPILTGPLERMLSAGNDNITNIQLYRTYIETYLASHPYVNAELDLIVTQKEQTAYGLPIEVYFFTKEKAWNLHEQQQSEIMGHLMTVAPEFGLHLYQRP